MSASVTIPQRDRPLSEQFRLVALEFADADAAATLLEELKSATLEKLKGKVMATHDGSMPESKAERLAKSGPEWETYVRQMCEARAKATKKRLQLAYIKMQFTEWQAADASARAEYKLGRMGP